MPTIETGDPFRRSDWTHNDVSAAPPTGTGMLERTERAEADERYQAFVSGTHAQDTCDNFDDPNHDYDRCVRGAVADPVLFLRQASDADEVNLNDVQQSMVGDCYLIAPLAALASTPEGRSVIKGAIAENKNDKGEVVSYTVTLHKPESHWLRAKTFSDVRVTVDGSYVIGHATARTGSGLNEVWPLVMEKAYAQYRGGYNAIGHGGNACDAMEVLTGREATRASLGWPSSWFKSFSPEQLRNDLATGKLVVLQTKSGISQREDVQAKTGVDSHNLIGAHAYAVTGMEEHDGHPCVKLHNPWNRDEPDLVPFDELTTWFGSVHVGSVR